MHGFFLNFLKIYFFSFFFVILSNSNLYKIFNKFTKNYEMKIFLIKYHYIKVKKKLALNYKVFFGTGNNLDHGTLQQLLIVERTLRLSKVASSNSRPII